METFIFNKRLTKTILAIILSVFFIMAATGCNTYSVTDEFKLIRIHIRANSNSDEDQAIKLVVRDQITEYLEKELVDVTDFETAYKMISNRLPNLQAIADSVLKKSGFAYKSTAKLNNEFFPTRSYENVVVESGYYDALILELGAAKGDNWWCVIYPPLCYLEAQGEGDFRYKSKLKELIDKYFA